jgi:ribosome biogenesis GTPase
LTKNDSGRLEALGWTSDFASAFSALSDKALIPARVCADHGMRFLVDDGSSTMQAGLSSALQRAGRPCAIGDWAAIDQSSVIRHILPRRTQISRKSSSNSTGEQVLAANVDLVLIATAVGPDFNLRRIERLLTVAYQSGAVPAVMLTKSDLGEASAYASQVEEIAPGVPVLVVSALQGEGIDEVRRYLPAGRTAVLIGSSGVGKSTLINRLIGREALKTAATHKGGQGRHTTSHRQLIRIAGGGLIIDTPGLREIQLWAGEEALSEVFTDIDELASGCRFSDCQHTDEPGCAVLAAIEDGRLGDSRLASYRKLQRELRSIEVRADIRLQIEERKKWKTITRAGEERSRAKRQLP